MSKDELLALYEDTASKCFAAAEDADSRPKLTELDDVIAPLAPYTPDESAGRSHARRLCRKAPRRCSAARRSCRRTQPPRHLAIQINNALHDLFCKYPEALLFGEDVAQKGGVYTVTKGLHKAFGNSARVQHAARRDDDPRPGAGLRQHGHAADARDPVPGVFPQRLRPDPRRSGVACSSSATTSTATRWSCASPALGYQRGFGGHFHNDNSITALRDIPGLVVGCPSRGDDAATMLRTLAALAKVDGRVSVFLEPIALYMTKDLYEAGRRRSG